MVIYFDNYERTTTLISSSTTLVNGTAPAVYFSRDMWNKQFVPRWITNEAPQRAGDFKNYAGKSDATFPIRVYLYGPNRNTNLAVFENNLSEKIYLNCNDINSSYSGNYVIIGCVPDRNEKAQLITVDLTLSEYNN
jgi:hypothetical protein